MPNHYAYIENAGENQICECGNDTLINDWYGADRNGRIDPSCQASADPEECTVCPSCGAIFRNRDLFALVDGVVAFAIAHHDLHDLHDPEFRAARSAAALAVYGTTVQDWKD